MYGAIFEKDKKDIIPSNSVLIWTSKIKLTWFSQEILQGDDYF